MGDVLETCSTCFSRVKPLVTGDTGSVPETCSLWENSPVNYSQVLNIEFELPKFHCDILKIQQWSNTNLFVSTAACVSFAAAFAFDERKKTKKLRILLVSSVTKNKIVVYH